MNEENLKKLYQTLSNDNFDLPSYEQFALDMQDDSKRNRLYSNIKSEYDLPDFETFTNDMGVKKKGASSNVASNGGASSSVQSTPPVTPTEPSGERFKPFSIGDKSGANYGGRPTSTYVKTSGSSDSEIDNIKYISNTESQKRKEIDAERTFKSPIAQPIATSAQEAESQEFKDKEAAYNEAMVGEIKRYGEVMQNKAADEFSVISQTPMTEISAAYNNATKFDDESAKQYLKGLKSNLVNDYLTYLDQAEPDKAQATRERINEIENKTRGEKNIDEQEFFFKLEKDALELKAYVANREAKKVIQSMDYDAYNVDATMLDEKIKTLAAERSKYVDANGTPKNSLGGKYQEYSSKIGSINNEMEAISTEFSNYVGEDGVLKDESKRAYVEGLQLKATELEKQANELQQNYSYLFENGKLKQTEEEKKAALITDQINQLATQHEALAEKYGVSQEKLDLINQAATFGNQVRGILSDGLNTDYPELKTEIDKAEAQRAKSLEFTQKSNEAEEVAVGFGLSTWNAVQSGAYSAMQFPKIAMDAINKDLLGNEKPTASNVLADLWATDLYDMASKGQFRLDSQVLNYGEGNETPYLVKKAELFGAGVGSVLTFIAGGEALSAVQVPKMMALWGTAYVTQEGSNYREALQNGLSPSDARIYSNLISAASATVELAIPDYKYIDDVVKPSVLAAYRAGTSVETAFKNAMKEFPKSLVKYTKSATKEGFEEGTENIVVDAVKNATNSIEGAEVYKELFDPKKILESITAGAMVGTAMTALNRPDQKSPTQQSLIGAIAETTEEDVLKMATIAPENVAVITEIQGIGAGMRQLPSFTALEQTEKNFVISESFRKKQLQRAQKEAGVKDPSIEAEIEKIDNDVDAVFNGKKVGEEYEVEVSKDEKVTNVVGNEKIDETAPISTQEGVEEVKSEEIVPEEVQNEVEEIKNKDWFHGSENEFNTFENRNPNITGFWFSDNEDNATTYGNKVKSAKLDIKNPLIIDAKGKKFTDNVEVEVLAKYPNEEPYLTKIELDMDEVVWMVKNGKRKNSFIEIPDHSKYDAVVFKNIIDPSLSSRSQTPQTSIAVLDNSQIKLKKAAQEIAAQEVAEPVETKVEETVAQTPEKTEADLKKERKEAARLAVSDVAGNMQVSVPMSKTAEMKKERGDVLSFVSADPEEAYKTKIRQYFAGGGTISTQALVGDVTGKGNRQELNLRIGMYRKDGIGIDKLMESIYNSLEENQKEKVSEMDVKDAILRILSSESRADMYEALKDEYYSIAIDDEGMTPQKREEYNSYLKGEEELYNELLQEEERLKEEENTLRDESLVDYDLLYSPEVLSTLSSIDEMTMEEIEAKYGEAIDENGNIDEAKFNEIYDKNEQGTKREETVEEVVSKESGEQVDTKEPTVQELRKAEAKLDKGEARKAKALSLLDLLPKKQITDTYPFRNMRGNVNKVVKALSKIAPNLTIQVVSDKDYVRRAIAAGMSESEAKKSAAYYDAINDAIVINRLIANANTLTHEAAHPVIAAAILSRPDLAKSFASQLRSV